MSKHVELYNNLIYNYNNRKEFYFFKDNVTIQNNKSCFQKKNKQSAPLRGFVIIELLVSIGIIVLVTAIVLINYRSSGETFALERSTEKLAQEIRTVEQMAMSAKLIKEETAASGNEFYPPGGFGIKIVDSVTITIFPDCNGDKRLTPGVQCGPPGDKFEESKSDITRNIELEPGVEIVDASPPFLRHIIFKGPSPTVYFSTLNGTEFPLTPEYEEAIIGLSSEGVIKTVKINRFGLVQVE